MSRRIGMPVKVKKDPTTGRPVAFTWRDHTYRVTVIDHWHLQDRWWVAPAEADRTGGTGASDRLYYRLLMADHQVFEVYEELTSKGLWILDIEQD
jgi:hypothetical protein